MRNPPGEGTVNGYPHPGIFADQNEKSACSEEMKSFRLTQ